MLTLTYLCIRYIRPLDGRFVKLSAILPRKGPLCRFPVQNFLGRPLFWASVSANSSCIYINNYREECIRWYKGPL